MISPVRTRSSCSIVPAKVPIGIDWKPNASFFRNSKLDIFDFSIPLFLYSIFISHHHRMSAHSQGHPPNDSGQHDYRTTIILRCYEVMVKVGLRTTSSKLQNFL